MERCKCGSSALNLSTEVCDVCYYKNQLETLTEAVIELLRQANGTEKYWAARQSVIKLTGKVRANKK